MHEQSVWVSETINAAFQKKYGYRQSKAFLLWKPKKWFEVCDRPWKKCRETLAKHVLSYFAVVNTGSR
jgi:hypothetical protein